MISLGLVLFGGSMYYWNKHKGDGVWKSVKNDAKSLKNISKILYLALAVVPGTYALFRCPFTKKFIKNLFGKNTTKKTIEIQKGVCKKMNRELSDNSSDNSLVVEG